MQTGKYLRFIGWLLTLGAGIGVGTVIGQQNPPAENKGVDAKVVGTVDLGPDMPGYQLRTRVIVVEPGGVFGIHGHSDRPAAGYVLEGTYTELREEGYVREHKQGTALTESRDVTHWGENRGNSRLVLFAADIVKQP